MRATLTKPALEEAPVKVRGSRQMSAHPLALLVADGHMTGGPRAVQHSWLRVRSPRLGAKGDRTALRRPLSRVGVSTSAAI